MSKLNEEQEAALKQLIKAHWIATQTGLFDVLVLECDNPDSINDVCDAAAYVAKQK